MIHLSGSSNYLELGAIVGVGDGVNVGVGVGFWGSSGSAVGAGVGDGVGVAVGDGRRRGVGVGIGLTLNPELGNFAQAKPETANAVTSSNGKHFLIITTSVL